MENYESPNDPKPREAQFDRVQERFGNNGLTVERSDGVGSSPEQKKVLQDASKRIPIPGHKEMGEFSASLNHNPAQIHHSPKNNPRVQKALVSCDRCSVFKKKCQKGDDEEACERCQKAETTCTFKRAEDRKAAKQSARSQSSRSTTALHAAPAPSPSLTSGFNSANQTLLDGDEAIFGIQDFPDDNLTTPDGLGGFSWQDSYSLTHFGTEAGPSNDMVAHNAGFGSEFLGSEAIIELSDEVIQDAIQYSMSIPLDPTMDLASADDFLLLRIHVLYPDRHWYMNEQGEYHETPQPILDSCQFCAKAHDQTDIHALLEQKEILVGALEDGFPEDDWKARIVAIDAKINDLSGVAAWM